MPATQGVNGTTIDRLIIVMVVTWIIFGVLLQLLLVCITARHPKQLFLRQSWGVVEVGATMGAVVMAVDEVAVVVEVEAYNPMMLAVERLTIVVEAEVVVRFQLRTNKEMLKGLIESVTLRMSVVERHFGKTLRSIPEIARLSIINKKKSECVRIETSPLLWMHHFHNRYVHHNHLHHRRRRSCLLLSRRCHTIINSKVKVQISSLLRLEKPELMCLYPSRWNKFRRQAFRFVKTVANFDPSTQAVIEGDVAVAFLVVDSTEVEVEEGAITFHKRIEEGAAEAWKVVGLEKVEGTLMLDLASIGATMVLKAMEFRDGACKPTIADFLSLRLCLIFNRLEDRTLPWRLNHHLQLRLNSRCRRLLNQSNKKWWSLQNQSRPPHHLLLYLKPSPHHHLHRRLAHRLQNQHHRLALLWLSHDWYNFSRIFLTSIQVFLRGV